MSSDYFLIARINALSGREGFVKIISYSDFPDRFKDLKTVFIDFYGNKKEFTVEAVKIHKGFNTLKFKNFNSDEEVKILLDKEIFVDKENLVKLPEGYYFVHELIGSVVLKNNEILGKLTDVLSYPANDVYVVESSDGRETLIPAISEFIESFNPAAKILILNAAKDLYEDDED